MRHAYLKLDWPKSRFNIIAGQTSDVISPLYPQTVNYSVGWWTGNIGYRRPQLRFTKAMRINKDVDLKLEGAFARTIGRNDAVASPNGTFRALIPGIDLPSEESQLQIFRKKWV